ncbi:MAG: SDR family NAD(P)-dependent oxidoreductase, partial [Gemmatimonadetes bacterium]|nr:SDR family NAD(P)-dependent oxidoreductase [Gemmatimonadota bacterium]
MNTDAFRLDGKLAVVTGGASGIGRAIALTFGSSGAAVHILDLDEEAAGATAEQIVEGGGTAAAHRCDVADQGDVSRTFEEIAGQGGIDILVNNAGIAHIGTVES